MSFICLIYARISKYKCVRWVKRNYRLIPIIGLSPTLPGYFAVIPPVDVANAVLPSRSIATAPTVS